MNRIIKGMVLNLLSIVKVHPTKMTYKKELQSLIKRLRPISCDKKLIRLGPNGDGGYLIPNDLEGIEACFSPGVGQNCGFEIECANRNMKTFLADGSIDEPPQSHEFFQFTKKNIGALSSENSMTLDDWVETSLPNSKADLLLQVDIEGFEYETFLSVSNEVLKRFRIIVAEFHFLNELCNKPFFELSSKVFFKLLQTHSCVHNHPNNIEVAVNYGEIEIPPITELTFYRNDRIACSSFTTNFPHPLDADNTSNPHLLLPNCWYR